MIKVYCIKCKEELNEPGGLLFLPPKGINVIKYHLCIDCTNNFLEKESKQDYDDIVVNPEHMETLQKGCFHEDDGTELLVIIAVICILNILCWL